MKKITAILILLALYIPATAATIYVNWDGTGDYTTIQAGINAAVSGVDTVQVAEGTYYENINFNGKNIILTSIEPTDPNIVADTIIDGGSNGSVVTFSGSENSSCELRGFTITNGNAYDGGGIYGNFTGAKISECIITGNYAGDDGGGLHRCNGVITNCTITDNFAIRGGGLYWCNGQITNCTITDNYADYKGGGLYECDGSITNCTITGNTENNDDSGARIDVADFATFSLESDTYVTIGDNVIYVPDDYETIEQAIFNAGNGDIIVIRDGLYRGVGNRDLDFSRKNITVRSENGPENCIIDCEGRSRAFTFGSSGKPDLILEGLTITRAYDSAIYCSTGTGTSRSKPTIRNCIFINNFASRGGAIHNRSGTGEAVTSPTIMNCIFIGNTASRGGAIYNSSGTGYAVTSPTIMNCIFIGNTASTGGAVYNSSATGRAVTSPTTMNCMFIGNTASSGGAIYNRTSTGGAVTSPTIMNCTFTGNSATDDGAVYSWQGISASRTEVTITNCIFWDNSNEQITGDPGTTTVSYSCIQDGHQGIDNIAENPLFANDSSDPNNWDFHLSPGSPCIDAGDNSVVTEITDLDGNPRIINGIVDMGAYETNYIEVSMKLTPQTLNCSSQGNWIKAHFVLPAGFGIEDVDTEKPATIDSLTILSDYMNVFYNDEGLVEIEVAFSRNDFCSIGLFGNVELTVRGSLTTGQTFYGTDTIRVAANKLELLVDFSAYWLQTNCAIHNFCEGFDLDQNGLVNLADIALLAEN